MIRSLLWIPKTHLSLFKLLTFPTDSEISLNDASMPGDREGEFPGGRDIESGAWRMSHYGMQK